MTSHNNEFSADRGYAYEVGMRKVEKMAQQKGSVIRAVNERGRSLSVNEADAFAVISTLALQLERQDQESLRYEDADMRTSKATLKGAMTGLLVAEAAYGDVVTTKEILAAIDIQNEVLSGDEANREAVNETLIGIGNAALEQMGSMDDLINRWESACVDSPSHQYYYRLGFGLVMGSASKAVHSKDLELLEREVNTGEYNWDQGLSDLLDSEK